MNRLSKDSNYVDKSRNGKYCHINTWKNDQHARNTHKHKERSYSYCLCHKRILQEPFCFSKFLQVNLDMTDSMGPGKLVRHIQSPSYTYDEHLICIGLGPSISSVICKNLSYSGPSYTSSPVSPFFPNCH